MFSRTREWTLLDNAIDQAIRAMSDHPIGSPEYVKALSAASQLHELRQTERSKPVSKDTLVIAGANLLGIVMIIKHEHVNVVASRAMSLLLRLR